MAQDSSKPSSELICSVCSRLFHDPVTLPCAHSFCLTCLESPDGPSSSASDQELSCPVCGEQHLIPESFPRNLKLKKSVEDFLEHAVSRDLQVSTEDNQSTPSESTTDPRVEVNDHDSRLRRVRTSLQEKLEMVDDLVAKAKLKEVAVETANASMREEVSSVLEEMKELVKIHSTTAVKLLEVLLKSREDASQNRLHVLSDLQDQLKATEVQLGAMEEDGELVCLTDLESRVSELSVAHLEDSSDVDFFRHLKQVCTEVEQHSAQLRQGLASSQRALRVLLNPSEMTFDPNTIHPNLVLSEDLKTVSFSATKQQYPASPQRFTSFFQALSAQSFSSGEHLWSFRAEGCSWVLAACHDGLPRSGSTSGLESSGDSWCLMYCDNLLRAYENGRDTNLRRTPSVKVVEMHLSFSHGTLAFYSVSEVSGEKTLLHSFSSTFSRPVFLAVRMMTGRPKAHITLS